MVDHGKTKMKLRLKDERPLLYLSGTGTYGMTEEDLIDKGAKYRCFSYAYVAKGGFYYQKKIQEAYEVSVNAGMGIMMDSAAHSFHKLAKAGLRKTKGKWNIHNINKLRDQTVEGYSKYVKKNQKDWDWCVTFDYVRECPVIYKMTEQLKELGCNTVPVYHGDQPIYWLEKYIDDGHKLICIGSIKRNNKNLRMYYNKCFNLAEKHGVLLHGLAVTSLSLMYGLPWYSVDSATWAKVAAFGCILCTSGSVNDTFGYVHMTNRRHGQSRGIEYCELDRGQKKALELTVNEDGFDVKDLVESGAARSLYNIYVFCNKIQHLKEDMVDSRMHWKSLLA